MDTTGTHRVPAWVRSFGLGLVLLLVLYAAAPLFLSVAPPPVRDQVRIVADDIYQAVDRTKKIPAEVALPQVARVGMAQFVKILPLDDEVASRVQARLDGRDFVDELVPFLVMVKEMYVADAGKVRSFDDYVRAHYSPTDNIPGMEHSMFSWQVNAPVATSDSDADTRAAEQEAGGFGMSLELAAELVNLYDALYLQGNDGAQNVIARLACTDEEINARLPQTAERVEPAVTAVLRQVRASMAPDAEMGHSLDAVLADADRLRTITLSLVHFMDLMVCKHYKMFASRSYREQQLQTWLQQELNASGGGRLWSYLSDAQLKRRYGVLIAVDGLQGHLVEALAQDAQQNNKFLQTIAAEQVAGMARIGESNSTRLAQQGEFLATLAKQGYTHDAYLPFFKDLYAYSGSTDLFHPKAVARGGISTTPTISVRNLPVIKTGAPVAGLGATGVPNFHFVDRNFEHNGEQQGRAYYFFGNDALQLTRLTRDAGMQTLPQRLPGLSSYSCAAQYDDYAHAGIDPFLNLALGEALRDFGEVLCFGELEDRVANELALVDLRAELLALRDRLAIAAPWYNWYQRWSYATARERAGQIIARIAEYQANGLPELLVYYNPWPDHFAHFTGPFADEILAPSGELARLDYWLGRLTELYRRAGVEDRTVFGMAGDHGLAPVFELVSPQERVLSPMVADGVPLEIIKISSDEGEGPKLTNVLNPPSMRGYDVVIASTAGGNLMFDFFVDQGSNWARQPIESELRRWQPIAWQAAGSRRRIDLIEAMLDGLGDSLEYLVVRTADGNNAEQTDIALYGPRGRAQLVRRQNQIYYRPRGEDLLKVNRLSRYDEFSSADRETHQQLYQRCVKDAERDDQASWCDEPQWRALAAFTAKPDSVVQLAHLYDSDRAGTINLFPASGVAYNSIVPGRHAGESFHEKDAFAGLWGAPIMVREVDPATMQPLDRLQSVLGGSIPTAIYEYLAGEQITEGEGGWGYPSLRTIVFDDGKQGGNKYD